MKQPEQSYTAIETAHGFVFFTDTTEGQKNRQDFLQFMADHYFDPHFNLGPVNVYRAEGVLKDGSYVNPGEGLYPEYAYLQMDKTPEMELVYRNEMKPTWEDFGSFCHNMHCTSSHRNRNIADILEEIESKDRKLLELSKQGTASDIRQQIEETGQDKALLDKLLKQYYDVRGHRTVGNILRDPMECVTVDGVRLFTPHRQVLAAGHGLFLPGEAKSNPSHAYAWINGDFTRIVFSKDPPANKRKYSINSLVYWVTYVHNVVYSFYRSMIYCYINSTQRCAGSIVIDIIPTNGADKRKFFPFAPYFPVTNVIKRYFYPYFPAIIGIKGYSFPYFPYLSGIMKIKTALYSLFSRLDWHKTVVFPCLGEIYEGIRSLSWEIPVT